jgi:hypothetical protein
MSIPSNTVMRVSILLLLGLPLLVSGCDQANTDDALEWQATLTGQQGFEGVSGSSSATSQAGQTAVSVNISGATPGAAHPWHIHSGSCESGGPIVGGAAAYPDLQVGAGGTASANATLSVGLDPTAPYFVNVHLSANDLATIVACGNLLRPGSNSPAPPGNGDY